MPIGKDISTIEQKRLLRLVIEAIVVRENALGTLQSTFAFLPILAPLFNQSNSCGPDGIRMRDVYYTCDSASVSI